MAITNVQQFITEARKQGKSDKVIYQYLEKEGLIGQQNKSKPSVGRQILNSLNPINMVKGQLDLTNKALGGASKILQIPEAITTIWGQNTGQKIGALSSIPNAGFKVSSQVAQDADKQTLSQLKQLPGQVAEGFSQGLFSSKKPTTQMPAPSNALNQTGLAGLAVDILGDPLNLLSLPSVQKSLFGAKPQKAGTLLDDFSNKLEQVVAQPSTADEAKAFEKIGKMVDGTVVETGETFGKQIAQYNLPTDISGRIKEINTRIPVLQKAVENEAIRTSATIDPTPIIDKLDNLSEKYLKAGGQDVAEKISKFSIALQNSVGETGKIAAKNALDLKYEYDGLKYFLGETGGIDGKVYNIIGNGLRDQLNNLPGKIGVLNKELSIYHEAIPLYAKIMAKNSKTLPIGIQKAFPYIALSGGNISSNITLKTAQFLKDMSGTLGVSQDILKTYLPSIIRNISTKK